MWHLLQYKRTIHLLSLYDLCSYVLLDAPTYGVEFAETLCGKKTVVIERFDCTDIPLNMTQPSGTVGSMEFRCKANRCAHSYSSSVHWRRYIRRIRESPTACTDNCKQLLYSPMPILFCHKISRVFKDSNCNSHFPSRPTECLRKEIHSLTIRPLHENCNLCSSMES